MGLPAAPKEVKGMGAAEILPRHGRKTVDLWREGRSPTNPGKGNPHLPAREGLWESKSTGCKVASVLGKAVQKGSGSMVTSRKPPAKFPFPPDVRGGGDAFGNLGLKPGA